MTISRSELIDPEQLTYMFVSASDPDTIGVEVALDGNVLMDCSVGADGKMSVLFDTDGGQFEFELSQLQSVLHKCEADLTAWRARLIEPGEMWESRE